MKLVTLFKIVAFLSVVVSTATVVTLVYCYIKGVNTNDDSLTPPQSTSTTKTTSGYNLPENLPAEKLNSNGKLTLSYNFTSLYKNTIGENTTKYQTYNDIPIVEDTTGSVVDLKIHDKVPLFVLTTTRGYALNGIFVFTQFIASTFLMSTDKKESRCRAYTWMLSSACSTTIYIVTGIGAVRIHSMLLDQIPDSQIPELDYIYKYYIMTGIYVGFHALGILTLLYFMRTPSNYNYKLLMPKTSM